MKPFFFLKRWKLIFIHKGKQNRSEYKQLTYGKDTERSTAAEHHLQPQEHRAHENYDAEDDAGTRRRHPSPKERKDS